MNKQKSVIITGGGTGIGKACASLFAQSGAHVFIAGRRLDMLQKTAKEISTDGFLITAIQTDITNAVKCEKLIDTVFKETGRVDVLINNAAFFTTGDALNMPLADWQKIMDVNISGNYFCARAFAQKNIQQKLGGVIINIGSIGARIATHGYSAYFASKAALESLTKSWALEWAQHHIRVNCIAPGHTETEGIRSAIKANQLDIRAIEKTIPQRRLAKPAEIAELALFLSSKNAKHITGQMILIDGGRSINGNF